VPQKDSSYLLDTNVVRAILDGDLVVAQNALTVSPDKLFLSAVAVEEMTRGRLAELNDAREGKSRVGITLAYEWFLETLHLIHRFQILNYTDADEAQYKLFPANIKRIGRQDCRIAAQALNQGFIVVTRNTTHFSQIPNLLCEDWTILEEGQ
jgi:tRNA(fMet)-specific endonuclease VapC